MKVKNRWYVAIQDEIQSDFGSCILHQTLVQSIPTFGGVITSYEGNLSALGLQYTFYAQCNMHYVQARTGQPSNRVPNPSTFNG